jgi:hypothetical protein
MSATTICRRGADPSACSRPSSSVRFEGICSDILDVCVCLRMCVSMYVHVCLSMCVCMNTGDCFLRTRPWISNMFTRMRRRAGRPSVRECSVATAARRGGMYAAGRALLWPLAPVLWARVLPRVPRRQRSLSLHVCRMGLLCGRWSLLLGVPELCLRFGVQLVYPLSSVRAQPSRSLTLCRFSYARLLAVLQRFGVTVPDTALP